MNDDDDGDDDDDDGMLGCWDAGMMLLVSY